MTHHARTSHCLWRREWTQPQWSDRELRFPPERELAGDVEFTLRLKGRRWWGTRVSEPLLRAEVSDRLIRWMVIHLGARAGLNQPADRRYYRTLLAQCRKRKERPRDL